MKGKKGPAKKCANSTLEYYQNMDLFQTVF